MRDPSPDRRDPLERLVIARRAVPARLDLLDVEQLDLPGGPSLTDLLNNEREDRHVYPVARHAGKRCRALRSRWVSSSDGSRAAVPTNTTATTLCPQSRADGRKRLVY